MKYSYSKLTILATHYHTRIPSSAEGNLLLIIFRCQQHHVNTYVTQYLCLPHNVCPLAKYTFRLISGGIVIEDNIRCCWDLFLRSILSIFDEVALTAQRGTLSHTSLPRLSWLVHSQVGSWPHWRDPHDMICNRWCREKPLTHHHNEPRLNYCTFQL